MKFRLHTFTLRAPNGKPYFLLSYLHKQSYVGHAENFSDPDRYIEHLKPTLSRRVRTAIKQGLIAQYGTADPLELHPAILSLAQADYADMDDTEYGNDKDEFYLFCLPPITEAHRVAYRNMITGGDPWLGAEAQLKKQAGSLAVGKKAPGRPAKQPEFSPTPLQVRELEDAMHRWKFSLPTHPSGMAGATYRLLKHERTRDPALKKKTDMLVLGCVYQRLLRDPDITIYVPPIPLFIERLLRCCEGPYHWPTATRWVSTIAGVWDYPDRITNEINDDRPDRSVFTHSLDPSGSQTWLKANKDRVPDIITRRQYVPVDAYLYGGDMNPRFEQYVNGKGDAAYRRDYLETKKILDYDPPT